MKDEVLNGLLVARTLFDNARRLCFVRDKYASSAGLVILQDAVELVFYCCLLERGTDEEKAIEKLSFDQLIGELKKQDMPVIKSGKLKSMNELRVHIKHRAELGEPDAVQQYYNASLLATDKLLETVIGKPLRHVVLADAIKSPEIKEHIQQAEAAISKEQFDRAMISIRKALYLAFEVKYDVSPWAEMNPNRVELFRLSLRNKAPKHTRDQEWIDKNVKEPTDYIRLTSEQISHAMLEIGIEPQEYINVQNLTPAVFRRPDQQWAITHRSENVWSANEDDARYCLDVVVSIIRNQQFRDSLARKILTRGWQARLVRDQMVLKRAVASEVDGTLTLHKGEIYSALFLCNGLHDNGEYVCVIGSTPKVSYFHGFIPLESCELEDSQPDLA